MEDSLIVQLLWDRSDDALSAVEKKYGKFLHFIAFNILRNESDAEECVDDAYFAAWNTIPPNKPEHLNAYLGKLTRNNALDRFDYNTAKKRNAEICDIYDEADTISVPDNVESESERKLLGRAISDFLYKQNKSDRIIFVLKYWYLLSTGDISSRLKISESKVTYSLFQTRKKLKKYLEKENLL